MSNQHAAPASGPADGAMPQPNGRASRAPRMTDLLRRYPNIQESERLEIIDFLKHGHPDEIAKATYLEGTEPRVIAFKKDHPEHFRSGLKMWLPWILILVAALLLTLLFRVA